jgi:acetyl esterase/lipase
MSVVKDDKDDESGRPDAREMKVDGIGTSLPATVVAELARIGPIWKENIPAHVARMVELFSPLLAGCLKGGVRVSRGLSYGSHARNLLDVFHPAQAQGAAAVLFVTGGGFVDGERNRSDEIYANVLYYFARHGIVGINMGYRLAPEAKWPEGSKDVEAAVGWIRTHAAELGIDSNRIFIIGHSAGAAHAAGFAYGADVPPVAGLIVISGRVRADNSPENPNAAKVAAYYGTDPSLYDARSPVTLVVPESMPTLIAVAEYENPLIDVYCLELAYRLAKAKRAAPPFLQLCGHNHISIVAHFNSPEDTLGKAILAFIANPR